MSGVILAVKTFLQAYGRALVLALLLHILLLTVLLQSRFTPVAKPPVAKAIASYLYQPAPSLHHNVQASSTPQKSADTEPDAATIAPVVVEKSEHKVDNHSAVVEKSADIVAQPDKNHMEQAAKTPRPNLAQRALDRAAKVDPEMIEQAAAASYQQFLQVQQQPKLTVEKRHQPLSQNPEHQVVTKLNDGRQLVRVKGGCRLADPTKQGFDALMAAKVVPCGDEDESSALLQQALQKHSKR